MKKVSSLTLAACLTLLTTGCGDVTVTGPSPSLPTAENLPLAPSTGAEATETRDVSGFSAVEMASVGILMIEQAGRESLTVTAEPDVLPLLTSEVENGRLRLGVADGAELRTGTTIVYRLTVVALDEIVGTGVAHVELSGIEGHELRVHLDGVSRLIAEGQVDSQDVVIGGTSRYEAEGLSSRAARIAVSGMGFAAVRVSERLEVSVNDLGLVEYYGDPLVSAEVSGSGRVLRAGS